MKFFLHGGARLRRALTHLTFAALLFFTFGAAAQTNGLSEAEVQGQQLVQELLEVAPATNVTQQGRLSTEDSKRKVTSAQITFVTVVSGEKWESIYFVDQPSNDVHVQNRLIIIHQNGQPNKYLLAKDVLNPKDDGYAAATPEPLNETQIWAPFVGSDFWIADLGLEFFHWPEQKILKHETKRTRACAVLESTNSNPSPGGYSRVVTWIDNESLAIIWAEAYDTNGKLLKVFNPKKVKKVNGQWELEDMEIRNVQTGSHTWIKFDLSAK